MKARWHYILGLLLLASLVALPVAAAPQAGKLSGVVVDPSGVPQMGATVRVFSQGALASSFDLLTNERGAFTTHDLSPGLYTVQATLAGFLPALERDIRISSSITTLVRIELDSLFTSFDRLRRKPNQQTAPDDWAWVLRTSTATRPVLRFVDGEAVIAADQSQAEGASRKPASRGRLELASGSNRRGTPSMLADAPSTAFGYDQSIGSRGRLLLAGQVSYESSAAASFAATWLPSGEFGAGPETTLVLRQSRLGPAGPAFRGVMMSHANSFAVGDRIRISYGAEYVRVGFNGAAASVRPHTEVRYRLSDNWGVAFNTGMVPRGRLEAPASNIEAALSSLDVFPALLLRDGKPVLESGWHHEIYAERRLGKKSSLRVSAFRDSANHSAVFGRGQAAMSDVLQDFFSNAFAYDGGESRSWGTRIAYQQRIGNNLEATVVYAWAGALVPNDSYVPDNLRDTLTTRELHSFAARISGRIPRSGTRFTAGYKWIQGPVVSRQDAFGETVYMLDPFLNVSVRQPVPSFFSPVRMELIADVRNLLAEGYVPMHTSDGQFFLIPALRTIRGGVCFQF